MGMTREEAYAAFGVPVGANIRLVQERYKQLGKQCHPQQSSSSPEAISKFRHISLAYATITRNKKGATMSLEEMQRLFQEVFFQRPFDTLNGSLGSDDDDDNETYESEEADDDEDEDEHTPNGIQKLNDNNFTQEERDKKKAEKRRLKKKRQRERKKKEKQITQPVKNAVKIPEPDKNKKVENKIVGRSSDEDEDGFDPNSAFFTKVVNKKKTKGTTPTETSSKKDKVKTAGSKNEEEIEEPDPRVLRSRQLAIRGNEMAQVEEYAAAIELFTEAINIDPKDFRFFGNRSYCYDRLQQYEKALRDAEKAIELNSDWAKGYFRQGRALAGLKRFSEAEMAFCHVLKLDPQCADAIQELLRVRTHQLMEMGFTKQASEKAIKMFNNVQDACESLIAGGADNLIGEVYISDEEEEEEFTEHQSKHSQKKPSDVKMKYGAGSSRCPLNPEGLTALWVGNVLPKVTEKKLFQMFEKCGGVTSVRMLPEKFCAFVNFNSKDAAGHAMQKLQGVDCEGQKLLIRFPDNPITNNITLRKTNASTKGFRLRTS